MTAREILIVEDDPSIRECYGMLFRREGLVPILETCGMAVERNLEKYRDVAAVILDYRMPGINGLELLKRLRFRHFTAPVIMVTAFATGEMIREALQLGVNQVLSKPVNVAELLQAVEASLQKGPLPPQGEAREAGGLSGHSRTGWRDRKDS